VTALPRYAELARVVGEDPRFRDEHDRLPVYEAAARRAADPVVLAAVVAALEEEPEAVGVSAFFLEPDSPAVVVEAVRRAVPDPWVERRVEELALLERLTSPAEPVDVAAELAGASGWLEEQLSRRSESVDVLDHLAVSAARRRARHDARERLRRLGK
jgi:hypothetical protein